MQTYSQIAAIHSKLHLYPLTKIVDKTLEYIEKYPKISITLENPIEKELEDSHRADLADPSSISEISLMFLKEGDLVNVIVKGDYSSRVLNQCARDLQELLEFSWETPAGDILCKKK